MLFLGTAMPLRAQEEAPVDPRVQLASDAFLYGYPLVLMAMTRGVMTNAATPSDTQAPVNQLGHARVLPTPDTRNLIHPTVDSLMSFAWLDLSREPMVLRLPDMKGRFFVAQMMDAYTNVFANPGKRTTGTEEQVYAIVGPNWNGQLPPGVRRIDSPTNTALLLIEVNVEGQGDLSQVHTLQNGMRLLPLSGWISRSEPIIEGQVDPSVDMRTPPPEQVAKLEAGTFFALMAQMLRENPPPIDDAESLRRFSDLGLTTGRPFDIRNVNRATAEALEQGMRLGLQRLAAAESRLGERENGWYVVRERLGQYGTDYLRRAAVAAKSLGASLPADRIFMTLAHDDGGLPLEGRRSYTIHFPKGAFPPAEAGWSVSLYDEEGYFVGNALDRYALGSRDELETNKDGSIDLVLQHDPPFSGDYRNWIPAPLGQFTVRLRLDWPNERALRGEWKPPPIVRTH
jgi:hypothetical protein